MDKRMRRPTTTVQAVDLLALKEAGYDEIVAVQNDTVVTDAYKGERLNKYVPIFEKYKIPVIVGTHPIPQKYYLTRTNLNTWNTEEWQAFIRPTLADEAIRKSYD
jgi:hypothetical protein